MIITLFLFSLIFISPIFAFLFGGAKFATLLVLVYALCHITIGNRLINLKSVFLIFFVLFLFIIGSLYWQDLRLIAIPVYLFVAIFLCSLATKEEVSGFIDLSSKFMLILCVLAIFSFFYVMLGGSPIASFPNPDGRLNYIFLGTLTNSYWAGLIRPSGIFDEPGAFSFFICSVVTLRRLFDKDSNLSWILLLLGLVTMSLAHIVFIFFYYISDRPNVFKMILFSFVAVILFIIIKNSSSFDIFEQVFLSRLQIGDDGFLKGDNRSQSLITAYNILVDDMKVFFWGISPESYLNSEAFFLSSNLPELGSNPLSQLVRMGAVLSSIYFIIISFLILSIIKGKKYFVVLGFGLLLLQRDFIYVVSYCMFVVMVLTYTYYGYNDSLKGN